MGVKQAIDPELDKELGVIKSTAPQYSLWTKIKLMGALINRSKMLSPFTPSLFSFIY